MKGAWSCKSSPFIKCVSLVLPDTALFYSFLSPTGWIVHSKRQFYFLSISTGSFSHTVWETLVSTDVGDTLSYKELASLSGNPKAARAVGRAVKSHSIPILVPCHRVVRARGEPEKGNYSGGDGVATKVWLLEHEKRMVS